jgi:hypothetical protein
MAGQWDTWLAALKAAGKGGEVYHQLTIDRGLPYSKELAFGADMSGDAFDATLKASPDAATELATFTITVGAYADGVTPVTLELTDLETDALPADGDLDGVEEFVFDILRTPLGGVQERLLAGMIPVAGMVTEYGS